ncbi:hypothetical protein N658DRAFT_294456 [Parathielavia hyrcaniae]|uniref:Uncharacterized protein n=1 Tax=Parathielavia hyrcaniae TaxID=113614 RepID=A0AAN6SXT7_9PEZI|nr:hypothetical protein N658DRAFT_294456 [Parathielavia hyrcaniae]
MELLINSITKKDMFFFSVKLLLRLPNSRFVSLPQPLMARGVMCLPISRPITLPAAWEGSKCNQPPGARGIWAQGCNRKGPQRRLVPFLTMLRASDGSRQIAAAGFSTTRESCYTKQHSLIYGVRRYPCEAEDQVSVSFQVASLRQRVGNHAYFVFMLSPCGQVES